MRPSAPLPSAWRREALRTNLWLVPTVEIVLAVALFAGTYALDRAAYDGTLQLPSFVISGTADAARQILTAIAAAVITVVDARLLDHDRDADARLHPVRAADAAQLHPRPDHADHARELRGDVRLRDPRTRLDRPGQPRGIRAARVDHGDDGARGRRRGGAGRVHRSHRQVDPAAAGDREHRRRPRGGDRDRSGVDLRLGTQDGAVAAEMLVRLDEDSGVVRRRAAATCST